jgi:hypothetical protein
VHTLIPARRGDADALTLTEFEIDRIIVELATTDGDDGGDEPHGRRWV